MTRLKLVLALALGLVLLGGSQVQAGPFDSTDWQFIAGTNLPLNTIGSDPVAIPPAMTLASTGTVTFTQESKFTSITGPSNIVLANLSTVSTGTPTDPSRLDHNGQYTLSLTIRMLNDPSNPMSGYTSSTPLKIYGDLGGSFSQSNSNITNQFFTDGTYTTMTDKPQGIITLNGVNFVVTVDSFTAPEPEGGSRVGSIGAHVELLSADGGGGPGPQTTPEPSTMLLSCLGLSVLGVARWRKRRAAANGEVA
jgi:hypothetical protein